MKLTLVNSQTDEEFHVSAEVQVTIGRGPMFGCYDKKVSRSHGRLRLTSEGNLHVTALHTNPCFFMKDGLPPIHRLAKNEEKILSDGDYFGLLPDSFWYKIVVTGDDTEKCETDVNIFSSELKSNGNKTVLTSETICKENKITVKNNEVANGLCKKFSSESSSAEVKSAKSKDTKKKIADEKNVMSCSNSLTSDKWLALENTKKLPLWMYEIDDFQKDSDREKLKRPFSYDSPEVEEKKNKPSSCESHVEVDATKVAIFGESSQLVEESKPSSEISNKKVQVENAEACNKLSNIEYIDSPGNQSSEEVSEENAVAGCSNDSSNTSLAQRGDQNSQKRPLCQFEDQCYRKNDLHRAEFCHPGDQDFVPYERRPICQYGSSCYRKNKLHRVEFQHPEKNSTAKTTGTKDMASPGKRASRRRVNYRRSSDEDEYDLEDPFIDDATSDEYVPSDLTTDEEEIEETDFSQKD